MSKLTAAAVQTRLLDAAHGTEFSGMRQQLGRIGWDDAAVRALVAEVAQRPELQSRFGRIRRDILGEDGDPRPYLIERYALLVTAAHWVSEVTALPVSEDVVALFLEEFVWLMQPRDSELAWFDAEQLTFPAICKLVTLRRFPAGQYHWEVSGLPRSTILRVKGWDRVRLAGAIFRMGGFAPLVAPHMPWRRPHLVLLESQHYLAYYRMAEAMRRQPRIRGLLAEAWFHAPDTYKASPHLAFLNRVFYEWGGVVMNSGPTDAGSGVYERGETRRRLAAAGKFTPTLGLVLWPRRAMLEWAAHYAGSSLRTTR
jgi:hypothetical protein